MNHKNQTKNTNDIIFGCMRSASWNIDEEIQWISQMRFIPKISMWINREKLCQYKPKKLLKLIMNGWYINKPNKFVPRDSIKPLLISMYIHRSCYKKFSSNKIREFLLKNAPVGCRDKSTEKFLNSIGVPAYFSGCLSLTLIPNPKIKKQDYILAIGLNNDELTVLKSRTTRTVIDMERFVPEIYDTKSRFEIAKAFLGLYQSAHCVITNKFHVACPCLALGTPVLLLNLKKDDLIQDPERFEGITDLFHNVDSQDFMKNNYNYDFENPPQNPSKYKEKADLMVKKVVEFTGFDNQKTQITCENPIGVLLNYFTAAYIWNNNYYRTLYYISNWEICKILFKKIFLGKDKFGLR